MKKISLVFVTALIVTMLTGCANSKWSVDVQMDPAQKEVIMTKIDALKAKIDANTGSGIMDNEIIEMARNYEQMGDLKAARDIYLDLIKRGKASSTMYHNLGRLYEQVGEYDKAIAQYQYLISTYYENSYLLDITWAYIRAKDRRNAEKYFNAWQNVFHTTDQGIQSAIQELRDQEAAQK